jgi:hypothetical protein
MMVPANAAKVEKYAWFIAVPYPAQRSSCVSIA